MSSRYKQIVSQRHQNGSYSIQEDTVTACRQLSIQRSVPRSAGTDPVDRAIDLPIHPVKDALLHITSDGRHLVRLAQLLRVTLMSTSNDSKNAEEPLFFPSEICLLFAQAIFGPCSLRRHVIDKLKEQHLMTTKLRNKFEQYQSGIHDQQIRRQALVLMDTKERQYYLDIRGAALNFSLTSRAFRQGVLSAERFWLQKPPVNITTFRDLCANPTKKNHQDREDICLELFPQPDFIDLPAELSDPSRVAKAITTHERDHLRLRTWGAFIPRQLNQKIYHGLLEVWLGEIEKIPKGVRSVRIICKRPFSPHTVGPLRADHGGSGLLQYQGYEDLSELCDKSKRLTETTFLDDTTAMQ